ncbi:hypothetical protein [Natronorubrum thiooxidans]|uniref:Uncharacterized protein n=1 Tax=Natronorubrum thiooxidans TaxID=308853 RepID=A0A1N7FAR6_9EURY|nr:hypothetical protein [Natronorubrum thiooxidans]SIR97478.1 hypothetical protein SAMN05421752_106148 [Natronorubrum thiooxidans]
MGEKKFTFIELHLDGDTQFGPRALDAPLPFGESETSSDLEDESDDEVATADDGSSGKAIGAIIALVVLVGIAVAAKKFRGDDETDLEAEDEPDVIVN